MRRRAQSGDVVMNVMIVGWGCKDRGVGMG